MKFKKLVTWGLLLLLFMFLSCIPHLLGLEKIWYEVCQGTTLWICSEKVTDWIFRKE